MRQIKAAHQIKLVREKDKQKMEGDARICYSERNLGRTHKVLFLCKRKLFLLQKTYMFCFYREHWEAEVNLNIQHEEIVYLQNTFYDIYVINMFLINQNRSNSQHYFLATVLYWWKYNKHIVFGKVKLQPEVISICKLSST